MPSKKLDYDDPETEERWCNQQRKIVIGYLKSQRVKYNEIDDCPAWHGATYVAIWAIESRTNPGWIGWWVISGDLPTDYVSAKDIKPPQHPRKALKLIASRWAEIAKFWKAGKEHPNMVIAGGKERQKLLPLLEARSR